MRSAWRDDRSVVGTVLSLIVVVLVVGVLLYASVRSSRESLSARFDTRADLAASFTAEYLRQVGSRETKLAQNRLSGDLQVADLEEIATDHEFVASIVLNQQGRLLQGYPAAPGLVNTDLTKRYAHWTASAPLVGCTSGRGRRLTPGAFA